MTKAQSEIMEALTAELQRGELTEDRLRRGIADVIRQNSHWRQDILYLQAARSSPESQVAGMMLIEDGKLSDGPPDPDDWPYQTVLDAVRDGWRIISFPNMALLTVDDKEFYGLGFEFILERWR